MTENTTKIRANLENVVQLLDDDEIKAEYGEAFASVMLNPTVTWAKFILTDDRTNGNGERIPKEEFANLISSGLHMPVKMAMGEISPGHPNTKPLGTITHLKEVQVDDGSSAIVALAALWAKERPADVNYLKEKFLNREPVDVSWEILYEDSSFNAEHNSMDLLGTLLRAATVVGNPAYEGRTPFLSIASKKKTEADDKGTNLEDELNELEKLQADLNVKVAELEQLQASVAEKETALAEKDNTLATKEEEISVLTAKTTELETELNGLRAFKAEIDAKQAEASKLEEIKTKFSEAEIERDEEFFTANAEKLIAMTDDALEFMLQELKVFAESSKNNSTASTKKTKIPVLRNNDGDVISAKEIAEALKNERKAKK